MLRDRIGLAVAVGNDAHITALGEHVYGAAHGMQNFVVVSFGHGGLGSCIYSNGLPYLGTGGSAGEMGHTCVEEGGRLCGCGRQGCLETYVTDRGMVQTAKELMQESTKPSLMRSLQEVTSIAIAQCCEQGDELAMEVFRKTGDYLGLGLANIASILDPEAIILADLPDEVFRNLIEPTKEAFDRYVFRNIKDKVRLVLAGLNNNERDVLGAAALAWTVQEYSLFK
jgi:glucokinase